MSTVPLWRKLVAGAGGLLAAAGFVGGLSPSTFHGSEIVLLAMPALLLAIAAGIVHRPKLDAQLFARAVWWANVVLGTAFALLGSRSERAAGALMTLGCCTALLVIGRKGLAEASERAGYAPSAFKNSLLLLMIFALADAQTFLLFGFVFVQKQTQTLIGAVMLGAGVAYLAGFVGLLRLRVWGAWVNLVTCTLLLATVLVGSSDRELQSFVCSLCGLHLLAASPLLLAATTRVRVPSLSPRWRFIAASSIVLGLAFTSVLSWLSHFRKFG